MKITPLDIQQQQFKGKFLGGIDPDEVDSFLQIVGQELENLIRENTELKDQVKKTASEMERMAQQEKNLRDTMLAAQRITEDMKVNAQKEASLIISEAEMKAEKLLSDAEKRVSQFNEQILELRRQKMQFETSLKSLLETYGKMLSINEE